MPLRRLVREFMEPAPDPRRTYRDVESLDRELLVDVRAAVATIAASRFALAARTAETEGRLCDLEHDAKRALLAGREDAARHALTRRQIAANELVLLQKQLSRAELESERLTSVEQQLNARIEALLARKRMLEARQRVASVQVRAGEALAGISDEIVIVGSDLARSEERAQELEARAAAIAELLEN
jgi:phage shock protein A